MVARKHWTPEEFVLLDAIIAQDWTEKFSGTTFVQQYNARALHPRTGGSLRHAVVAREKGGVKVRPELQSELNTVMSEEAIQRARQQAPVQGASVELPLPVPAPVPAPTSGTLSPGEILRRLRAVGTILELQQQGILQPEVALQAIRDAVK